MIEQILGENEYGEPQLILKVSGYQDIWRLGFALSGAQIEFGAKARLAFVWMRKKMGAKKFAEADGTMTGGSITKRGWHRTLEEEYR